MKLRLVLLIFLILAGGWRPAFAQYLGSGTITAAGTTCTPTTCVSVGLFQDTGAVSFTISGTWSATLQFEVSEDNTNFVALNAYPPNSTTAVTSTAANGTWTAGVAGMVQFRVRASAYSSGTATVSIQGSKAVALSSLTGGGGGGGGTVTAVTGVAPVTSTGGTTPAIGCATCTTSAAALTSGDILEGGGLQAIVADTKLDDGNTTANTLTYTGTGGVTASAGPVTAGGSGGVGGTLTLPEGTAASAVLGDDLSYADSTAHRIECSFNNGSFSIVPTLAATNAFTGTNTFKTIGTATECASSASPAVCGSAASGFFVIAAAAGTVTVDTSAVTANSIIGVAEDFSLGTALSVTCNTATAPGFSAVTARTPGVSFTFAVTNAPSVNPDCFSYFIIN